MREHRGRKGVGVVVAVVGWVGMVITHQDAHYVETTRGIEARVDKGIRGRGVGQPGSQLRLVDLGVRVLVLYIIPMRLGTAFFGHDLPPGTWVRRKPT